MPRRERRRRAFWPLLLAIALVASGAVVVQAAVRAADPLPPLTAADAADAADAASRLADAVAAPGATASGQPYVRDVTIVTPPPPPPPPASGGKRSGGKAPTGPVAVSYTAYCAAGGGWTATPSSIQGLLAAANAERARFGSPALTWSASLASLAQVQSDAQAANYDAGSPGSAMAHGNLPPSPGGQNVAVAWTSGGTLGLATAMPYAHHGWMTSTHGHCTNILNPAWRTMGAASTQSADGRAWYTTQNFGG